MESHVIIQHTYSSGLSAYMVFILSTLFEPLYNSVSCRKLIVMKIILVYRNAKSAQWRGS